MSIASAAVLRSAGGSAGYAEIPTLDGSSASGSARSSSSVEANGTVSTRRTRSELSLTLPRTLSSASDLQHLAMAAGGPAPTTPSVMTATTPMLVDSSAQQQQQQAQSNGSGKAAAAKAVLSATKAALASRTRSTTRSLLRRLGLLPRSDGSSKGSAAAADKSGLPAMNLATAWSKQPPLPPPSPLQLPADLLLQNKGITGQDARRLCAALVGAEGGEPWPDMPRIASLKVGGNELGDEGAEAVAQALLLPERGRPSSLLTLDLGFNDVGDAGAEALARSLRHNATLRTLYLSGNQIGAAGCRALADALSQRASSIMVLHLTGNADIGPEGGSALGQALRRNTTLTTLYVAGCSLGPQGSAALFAGLAYNRSLRFLYAVGASFFWGKGFGSTSLDWLRWRLLTCIIVAPLLTLSTATHAYLYIPTTV